MAAHSVINKDNRTAMRLILVTVAIDLVGFGIIIPILGPVSAKYLPHEYAGRGTALLMASYSILQMLFSPVLGRLSDRFGRRPILLLSLFGSTLSYLIFAFANSYALLLTSRLLAGFFCANIAAAQAYIADITSEKDRTAGMGLVGIAFGMGFVFGPIIGGLAAWAWHVFLPQATSHTGPGLVAALICGINLVWACFRLPESLPPERRGQVHFRRFASAREAWENLRHPTLGPLIILFFLVTFAFANLEVSFSLYAKKIMHLDEEHIFGLFAFIGFVMALVQGLLIRRAVRYIPEQILMILGIAMLTLGLFMLPLVIAISYILFTMIILTTGQGLALPSILSLISRAKSAQNQGSVFGTSQAASSLARIVGPVFGGIIFDFGPRWPFWVAAAIMGLAVWWAAFARARILAYPAPLQAGEARGEA